MLPPLVPSAPTLAFAARTAAPRALARLCARPPDALAQKCTVALVKNIVGTGVLTLPAGIAKLNENGASSEEVLLVAAAFTVAACAANAWGFLLIGEACSATGEESYVGAWSRTLGPKLAFVPALTSLLLCFTASVACLTVIGDTFTDLIAFATGVEYAALDPRAVLLTTSAAVLLPLCLLPSLAPLGTASLFGVGGVFVTAGAMLARCLDGSYAVGTGAFYDAAVWPPTFVASAASDAAAPLLSSPPPDISVGSLCVFASLLSNAFLAHYNAPAVYSELAAAPYTAAGANAAASAAPPRAAPPPPFPPPPSPLSAGWLQRRLGLTRNAEAVNDNFRRFIEASDGDEAPAAATAAATAAGASLDAYRGVVVTAFSISLALFLLIAGCGYATFGVSAQPLVLSNYASADPLAGVARAGVALCVVFEFPLLERPFRLTALQLLGIGADGRRERSSAAGAKGREGGGGSADDAPPSAAYAVASVAFLSGIAALGVPLDALSALSGSTGGALLIYIAPALMALRCSAPDRAEGAAGGTRAPLLWALVALGAALAVIGTAVEVGEFL